MSIPGKISLFEDTAYQGDTKEFSTSQKDLASERWANKASSIILQGGNCILYSESDYKGYSHFLPHGEYPSYDSLPLGNDNLESFQLLPEKGLCLFPEPNFLGEALFISVDDYDTQNFTAKSAIVFSGKWDLFSEQEQMGAQKTLEPKKYPNLFTDFKQAKSVKRAPHGTLKVVSKYQSNDTAANTAASGSDGGNGINIIRLADDRAIELIFDASNSMNILDMHFLEGQNQIKLPRLEIAKRVLKKVVTENLPAGIPAAIRVFGPSTPESDNDGGRGFSKLFKPLAPLPGAGEERDTLLATIDSISAGGWTPIAFSINKAKDDMKDAKGPKTVVLITDGEETCGGNVLESIRNLCDSKEFEVKLNVVGIQASNANREEFQRWADAGGGSYYDATDSAELQRVVGLAVGTPFEVLDDEADTVAEGFVDGEEIELSSGKKYTVKFKKKGASVKGVFIKSDQTTEVSVYREIP